MPAAGVLRGEGGRALNSILLGVTGSVAAVRTPELYSALRSAGCSVRVAATNAALSFFDPELLQPEPGATGSLPAVPGREALYLDTDEWPVGRLYRVGEPVLHIELRRWADALVIAPLDAHTLAKLALGLCDNLLTCVYRAWDTSRPILLSPAMNTLMWEHPATARHLGRLLEDHGGGTPEPGAEVDAVCEAINLRCPRLRIVPPQSKRLACGDQGMGGMASVPDIVEAVRRL